MRPSPKQAQINSQPQAKARTRQAQKKAAKAAFYQALPMLITQRF
jgi:hypothetical protein